MEGTTDEKPKAAGEPVPKKELEEVRRADEAKGGALATITRPIFMVCDPVLKKCVPVLEQHWQERYRKPWPDKFAHRMLILDFTLLTIIAFLIVAGLVWYFVAPSFPTPALVNLNVDGPTALTSGDDAELVFRYENASGAPLGCAQLLVRLPEDAVVVEGPPSGDAAEPFCALGGAPVQSVRVLGGESLGDALIYTLGDVAPGERGEARLKARFYGAVGGIELVTSELLFWEEAQTKPSRVSSRTELAVGSSVLALLVSLPDGLARGQQGAATVTYENHGDRPLDEVVLRVAAPEDFVVVGALPQPDRDGDWTLRNIAPGERGTVTLFGYFRAAAGPAPTFVVRGYVRDGDALALAAEERLNADPLAGTFDLTIETATPTGTPAARPGDIVNVIVRYKNRGAEPVRGFTATIDPQTPYAADPSPADWTWDATDDPALAEIGPGASGELRASFTVREIIDAVTLGSDDFPVISVSARATYFAGDDGTRPVRLDTAVTDVRVASRLDVDAAGFYYTTTGDQLGVGPLPPKAGETTRYWVFIRLENTTNAVLGVRVEARLPAGATWTGRSSVTVGEAADLLQTSGRIQWDVGTVPAFAGDVSNVGASFEIAVTPTDDDVGRALPLLTDIKVSGTDEVTGLRLLDTADDVTTELEFDERARGKGAVVR